MSQSVTTMTTKVGYNIFMFIEEEIELPTVSSKLTLGYRSADEELRLWAF